jgi:endonuclease/exonuclease/phosphatase (EEP) superfamily protein YafD
LKFRHRKRQLQELHLMVKNVEKPVVVAGDFNVFRGGREFQLFAMRKADLKLPTMRVILTIVAGRRIDNSIIFFIARESKSLFKGLHFSFF